MIIQNLKRKECDNFNSLFMNSNQKVEQPSLYPEIEEEETKEPQPSLESLEPSNEDNARSLLALSLIQGVGFVTIRNLFSALNGKLKKIWELDLEQLAETLKQARAPQPTIFAETVKNNKDKFLDNAQNQLRFLARKKISIIFRYSKEYPSKLEKLPDPPAWLFVEGNPEWILDDKIVAVVGTREPTKLGVETATRVSNALIERGCIILSGLAEGIDEAGHQSAVNSNAPTIAVLGHGVDVVFPSKTAMLRRQIVESGGVVISEYLYSDSYAREKFVQRNRIQAALSDAVTIIEAKTKSGTAHTFRFAKGLEKPILGATIGGMQKQPTHELLEDIKSAGYPVFDFGNKEGINQFSDFIFQLFKNSQNAVRKFQYLPYKSVLNEIKRTRYSYAVSDDHLEWLITEIQKLKGGS